MPGHESVPWHLLANGRLVPGSEGQKSGRVAVSSWGLLLSC